MLARLCRPNGIPGVRGLGRFSRNILLLAGGTVLGQVIFTVLTPFVTRIYSPEAFGVFGVAMAVVLTIGNIGMLHYNVSIPLVSDAELPAATALCLVLAVFVPALVCAAMVVSGVDAMLGFDAGQMAMIYVGSTVLGIGNVLVYLVVRRGDFRLYGASRIVQSSGQGCGQLLFGTVAPDVHGLLGGYVLGFVASVALLRREAAVAWRRALACRPAAVKAFAARYRQFPAYAAPTALLQQLEQFYPTVLLAGLFGAGPAGFFLLAQRILGLPTRVIAQSASQALLAEFARDSGRERLRVGLRWAVRFLGLGALCVAPAVLVGPRGWGLVFGPGWAETWSYVAALAPLFVFRFATVVASNVLVALGRQEVRLLASAVTATVMVATFLVGHGLGWSALSVVAVYAALCAPVHLGQLLAVRFLVAGAADDVTLPGGTAVGGSGS